MQIFDKPLIQTIVDFKWATYCYKFYKDVFTSYVFFVFIVIADTYVTQRMRALAVESEEGLTMES